MSVTADEMTGPTRRRTWRLLLAIVAIVAPIGAMAGAGTWFVRSYIFPPMFKFPEIAALAPVAEPPRSQPVTRSIAAPAPVEPAPAPAPTPPPAAAAPTQTAETTGSQPASSAPSPWPAPQLRPGGASSVWNSVPLPGPPRQAPPQPQALAAPDQIVASEPISGPIPLPPQRPRGLVASSNGNGASVPMPRRRPAPPTAN